VASSVNRFLDGLLSDERRGTGWMRAEAAGDPGRRDHRDGAVNYRFVRR
jgi:hypothetical protein